MGWRIIACLGLVCVGAAGDRQAPPAAPSGVGIRPADPKPVGASVARTDPVVIADCRLAELERQEIPSQRDGVLLAACTEPRPGEEIPADRIVRVRVGDQERRYRRLREGDRVEAGQLVALLDDRLARDTCAIKQSQVALAQAEWEAAEKARDEAKERYLRQLKLRSSAGGSATSEEDVGGAQLAWYRNHYDAVSKREAIALAQVELRGAQTVLGMYEIRAAIPGVVKRIHKQPGEAVRSLEPVVEVRNPQRLRAEGLVGVEEMGRLRPGMKVFLEPVQRQAPGQRLDGHLREITGVAVAAGRGGPEMVSASEDGTIRVWDRSTGRERRVLRHPSAVRSVACTPPGAPANLCLAGTADGSAWLWNLESTSAQPARELRGPHQGAVTSVAFAPCGKTCATAGDDHAICLWDVATAALRYRLPAGHLGPVTWLRFAGPSRLVSAGKDNTLRVWALGAEGGSLETTLAHRSGDVPHLDVSPDGRRVLFDQGSALHALAIDGGATEAVLRLPPGAAGFTTLAMFSPDGKRVLTAGGVGGKLRLWSAPTAGRWQPACELVPPDHAPPVCAAFAPDGSFLVAGTRDRRVLVWDLSHRQTLNRRYPGVLTLVEQSVDVNAEQVRIWAEVSDPEGQLVPGTAATLVIHPGE